MKKSNTKKILAAILSVVLVFGMVAMLASCGGNETADNGDTTAAPAPASDMEYVKEKGTLVIGVTDFAPMDYHEGESEEWVGFDADLARAFAESLGVKAEIIEIEWDNKLFELDGKTIDCVWNGMTLTDEVKASMECSNGYCNNAQVIIVPKDKADEYATAEACKELNFAVEAGSAGAEQADAYGFNKTEVLAQADAVMEVAGGTCDAAIIDTLMAIATVGEGTAYEDLTYTAKLNTEEYGVGFRKGSDLANELNEFFKTSYADGSMMEIAEKYGIQDTVIAQ